VPEGGLEEEPELVARPVSPEIRILIRRRSLSRSHRRTRFNPASSRFSRDNPEFQHNQASLLFQASPVSQDNPDSQDSPDFRGSPECPCNSPRTPTSRANLNLRRRNIRASSPNFLGRQRRSRGHLGPPPPAEPVKPRT
jgi:hypothetical protein